MALYTYNSRCLTEALLNLIVFERVNWMFAFFPGSFRTKSKICITAGLGPDWTDFSHSLVRGANQASLQQLNWTASNQQGYLI